jgi:predicted 3-demethylubiquinone-9 3-methyltransferase (glyoxalase superfamily)
MSEQKVTPFFWFDNNAEEAVAFWISVFKGKLGEVSRYGPEGPGPEGSAMVVPFTLYGQEFLALNGGPEFEFTPAISFVINCDTQEEIDALWEPLCDGGETMQCGWVRDKFGMTWQIVPSAMPDLLDRDDPERASRVMQAMFKMVKLDLNVLRAAYDNREPATPLSR